MRQVIFLYHYERFLVKFWILILILKSKNTHLPSITDQRDYAHLIYTHLQKMNEIFVDQLVKHMKNHFFQKNFSPIFFM